MSFTPIEPFNLFYFNCKNRQWNRTRVLQPKADRLLMSLQQLDYFFPFFIFFYGFLMLVVLDIPFFSRLGETRMSLAYNRIQQHRPLAVICFFAGGLWALQNLWF